MMIKEYLFFLNATYNVLNVNSRYCLCIFTCDYYLKKIKIKSGVSVDGPEIGSVPQKSRVITCLNFGQCISTSRQFIAIEL